MSVESIESDDKLFERFCVRRPPELTRERLRPTLPLILAELGRLDALKPGEVDSFTGYVAPVPGSRPGWVARPPVSEGERLGIIATEAWEAYLVEWESRFECKPFRGRASAYTECIAVNATRHIHHFLAADVKSWRPGARRPRALHRAVESLIRRRIVEGGGGCEICHAGIMLELHHLHYASFGSEVPSDVAMLCRRCHQQRHAACGLPQDHRWRDSMQWPAT